MRGNRGQSSVVDDGGRDSADRVPVKILCLATAMLLAVGAAQTPDSASARKEGGRATVTDRRPTGFTPAKNVSARERRENFESLWNIIDAQYAHFVLKSIDWAAIGRRYRARLD